MKKQVKSEYPGLLYASSALDAVTTDDEDAVDPPPLSLSKNESECLLSLSLSSRR